MKARPIRREIQILLWALVLISTTPLLIRLMVWQLHKPSSDTGSVQQEVISLAQQQLEREILYLDRKLESKKPGSYYLVINSSSNEFRLYKGKQLIKKDKCSTGSYTLLKNGPQQQWLFKTPKGEFRIRSKTSSPVWKKPDWAFVEEGLPVPAGKSPHSFRIRCTGRLCPEPGGWLPDSRNSLSALSGPACNPRLHQAQR